MTLGWDEEIKKKLAYCGRDVFIGHGVVFTCPEKVVLHDFTRIDPRVHITTALECKGFNQIMAGAVLSGGKEHKITLGKWSFIGYNSMLFCCSEDYSGDGGPVNLFWNPDNKTYRGDIVFEDYSGIASGVTVFPGVHFPEGCTVGAGSTVRKTPEQQCSAGIGLLHTLGKGPKWSIYLGNPFRFHKDRNKKEVIRKAKEIEDAKTNNI